MLITDDVLPRCKPMPALTLWPEWLPCFTELNKRVENRTWAPAPSYVGQRFALHAGKSIGGGSTRKGLGWVVETARAAGWDLSLTTDSRGRLAPLLVLNKDGRLTDLPIPTGVVVATARLSLVVAPPHNMGPGGRPWRMNGQFHWHFDDLHVLETPIAAVGHQGIWSWQPPEGFVDAA